MIPLIIFPMSEEDLVFVERMADHARARDSRCEMPRLDLLRLLVLAGMDDSLHYLRASLHPNDWISVSANVILSMVRQALACANGRRPVPRGRGRWSTKGKTC
jgi:hypothetical protein